MFSPVDNPVKNNTTLIHLLVDVDECYPTNDCMQKCTNTIGSYNCSCDDEFFKDDPDDWRKCSGGSNQLRKRGFISLVLPLRT